MSRFPSGVNFANLAFTLQSTRDGKPAVAITYGAFINTVIDFIVVALAIFLTIRAINCLQKKQEAAVPSAPSKEEILLAEIRDILKAR
ncbi:MAG: MscL family protein [bacterium]